MPINLRTVAGLATAAVVLAGCGSPPERRDPGLDPADIPSSVPLSAQADPDAVFRYAGSTVPWSFDPMRSAGGTDQLFQAPIFDRLVQRNVAGELEPMLATEWSTAGDGRSLTMKLREGLTFTDGSPFDATAVKANLERYLSEKSSVKGELKSVTGVEATGPLTVTISVSGAVGPLVSALSARPGMMVSPAAIAAGNVETNPIGIGPFTATKVVPGQSVSLVKTPNYWDPSAQRVASMEITAMPEAQTRLNALNSGQVDAAMIEPDQIASVAGSDLKMISGPTPLFYFLAVNASMAPFDNPKVRNAVNLALDRESLAVGMFEGFCTPQVQLWPEQSFAYDQALGNGLAKAPYDVDAAKQLMREAGYENGIPVTMAHFNNTRGIRLGEAMQNDLAAIGIDLELSPGPSLLEPFAVNKTVAATVSAYTGPPDPDAVINRLVDKTAIYNPGVADYPGLAAIATEGANATEIETRKAAYTRFSEALIDANTHVFPICMGYETNAFSPKVSNLHAPSDYLDLRGVAVDR